MSIDWFSRGIFLLSLSGKAWGCGRKRCRTSVLPTTRPEWSDSLRTETCQIPFLANDPRQVRLPLATGLNVSGEQCTVALVADLREVSDRGRRIRYKLEAVFCRRCKRGPRSWCPHRHPNRGGGVLDVIPGEPGCRVAERQPRFNAAPVNAERSEESTHKSQCMSGVEAVRNTKGVEDGAKVLDMKNGLAAVQVDLYTAVGDLSRPQE